MANPPPPYSDITGISRSVMKDNAQTTVPGYDGNARPGELTMDLTTDPPTIYIGNNLGQLTQVSFGGVAGVTQLTNLGNVQLTASTGNIGIAVDAIRQILPAALTSNVHIAANTVGNVATIITDATTANIANTLVLRDANGAINVNGWTVGTHLTAVNYTATNSDYWIGTTTKSKTITLPNAANGASTGRQYQIADTVHSGNPGTTIAAQSPATVVGNQPSQQGQLIVATYVGATWYLN
jgi:hypothetical protein